jgi:protein TonB
LTSNGWSAGEGRNAVKEDTLTDPRTTDSEFIVPEVQSVALIGPGEELRQAMAGALAESGRAEVIEYDRYPSEPSDLESLLRQNFDVIFIDIDDEPEFSLELVRFISSCNAATVMAYSRVADQDNVLRCMTAGARDCLTVPVKGGAVAEEDSPKPPAPAPGPEGIAAPVTIPAKSSGPGAPRAVEDFSRPLAPTPRPEVTPPPLEYGLRPSPAMGNQDDQAFLQRSSSTAGLAVREPISISRAEQLVRPTEQAPPSPAQQRVPLPGDLTKGTKIPAQGEPHIGELLELLRPQIAAMNAEDNPTTKGKWVKVAAISAGSILILSILAIWLFRPGTTSRTKASVEPGPTAAQVNLADNKTPKPSPSTPSIPDAPPAAVQAQPTPVSPSTAAESEDLSPTVQPAVQSQMMNDQLAAPTRISRDIRKPVVENEPPPPSGGLGTTGTGNLGGGSTIASVFTGSRPVVHAAPAGTITISAVTAFGLLIQKTAPVYPAIAREARVSGTVQILTTISKAGIVKEMSVVSGPLMLRQAAVDAVRTWRYKPYKLNNEPMEVQTTISVVFTLGN